MQTAFAFAATTAAPVALVDGVTVIDCRDAQAVTPWGRKVSGEQLGAFVAGLLVDRKTSRADIPTTLHTSRDLRVAPEAAAAIQRMAVAQFKVQAANFARSCKHPDGVPHARPVAVALTRNGAAILSDLRDIGGAI